MPRMTVEIDAGVLAALKRRQRETGKSLGELVSELLARALSMPRPLKWHSQPMRALVDIDDKEALWRALEDR